MFTCRAWLVDGLLLSMFVVAPVWAAENPTIATTAPEEKLPEEETAGEEPILLLPLIRFWWQPESTHPKQSFELTPAQQSEVDSVLQSWEKRCSRVKNLSCHFKMWEYDSVFGPADKPKKTGVGRIKYFEPDKVWYGVEGDDGEQWSCDSKTLYEHNRAKRQVIERPLPEKLQGKFLTDGPYPFFFGVKAEKLKQRYWWRIVTPPKVEKQVWLEAWPRFWQDTTRYQRIEIILEQENPFPLAVQFHGPNGKSRTVYRFSEVCINSIICPLPPEVAEKMSKRLPEGWELVVEESVALEPKPAAER